MIWSQLSRLLLSRGAGRPHSRQFGSSRNLKYVPRSTSTTPPQSSSSPPPRPKKQLEASPSKPPKPRPRRPEARWSGRLRNPYLVFADPRSRREPFIPPEKGSMSNYANIVTTPSADTAGASLVLHFDHRRYHFGSLTQGLQRAYIQRGYALTKLENLFISGTVSWDNVGGLLGMMLTAADSIASMKAEQEAVNVKRKAAGRPLIAVADREMDIGGGENLTYMVATARGFIFRQGLPINTIDFDNDRRKAGAEVDWSLPDWEDDSLRVWVLPVASDAAPETNVTSPRKRSFDVMTESTDAPTTDAPRSRRETNKKVYQDVVGAMFKSDWSRDRLVESPLGDMKPPVKVWIRRDGVLQNYNGPWAHEDPAAAETMVFVREPWPAVKTTRLPETQRSATSVSYIVKNRGRRGKFDPVAAKKLGVDPREFGKLTSGESVQGKDGVTVTPDMVLGQRMEGTGFVFADIPSQEYIDGFVKRPEWAADKLIEGIGAIFWNLGRGVVDDERIREFIGARPNLKHIMMGADISPNMLTYESVAGLHTKLALLDPNRFPVLYFDNRSKDVSSLGPSAVVGRTGMSLKLLPKLELNDAQIDPFPTLEGVESIPKEARLLAREAQELVSSSEFQTKVAENERDIPNRDTEVIALGTGSALPSKYRNVSATLIRVPGVGNYLLDCGENTIGQLRRAYHPDEFNVIMRDMRAIFISHMHADHHLGLGSILAHWNSLTKGSPDKKMTICGPPEMLVWIKEYACVEDIGLSRINLLDASSARNKKVNHSLLAASGLASIEAVRVHHCHNAFAGILTWPSGLKIAYSGDCRPSDLFASVAQDATLLIHESTFDNDKGPDAIAKRHCTMAEALSVAGKMRARRVLLTHFSQRYSKIPILGERKVSDARDQVVLFAFDHMRVKLGEFKHAEAFLPALRKLFDETPEAEDQ